MQALGKLPQRSRCGLWSRRQAELGRLCSVPTRGVSRRGLQCAAEGSSGASAGATKPTSPSSPASPAPAASSGVPPVRTPTDWAARGRQRTRSEVVASGARLGLKASDLESSLDNFEALLPQLSINLELMKASDWARVVVDPELAAKLVLIKVAFPALNVEELLTKHPRTLLWSRALLEKNISEVSKVLHQLPRPEVVLTVLPEILDPKQCFSVVATIRKWFPKHDPLEVLQADPEVVRRAERVDVPLEPVFFDAATQTWTAAGYSREKQEEWQVYIEKEIYKRKPQPIDKQTSVVVGAAARKEAAAAAAEACSSTTTGFAAPPEAAVAVEAAAEAARLGLGLGSGRGPAPKQ